MKIKVYHGTTADNLQSILKHGLSCDAPKRVWNCSEDAIYLWSPHALIDGGECEEMGEAEALAFRYASDSAQCALGRSLDCRAVVLCIEVDSEELKEDQSCEYMQLARCIRRDILLSDIVEIQVSSDLSLLRAYFIGLMLGRDYFNNDFTELEERIAKKICENVYPEDVDDICIWETVHISGREIIQIQ